jgi:predicted ATPase
MPWLDAFSRLCREQNSCIALLRRHAPMWLAQMPWLVDEAERLALQRETTGATRARMLREMAQALDALTAEKPLVLALEDLHWSDYSTLDLIAYVARRREPAPLMLIGTFRPVEVILSGHPLKAVKHELESHQFCEELALGFLSENAVADYLKLRIPMGQLPEELPQLIHGRTEGNPLFMVNMVDELLTNCVIDDAGRCHLNASVEEIAVAAPAGVLQMIEKHAERLSAAEKQVLEACSVEGMEFSAAAVAAALQTQEIEIDDCCQRLARRQQFLQPATQKWLPDGTVTGRYGFGHALYQNAFYARLTSARRAELHLRIANYYETHYGDQAIEIAAELALHFEEGRDGKRAVKYLILAARQANQVFAAREAVVLANRGLVLVARLASPRERCEQELALQVILGNALMATKGFAAPEVRQTYSRARELCRELGETSYLLPVLYGLFVNHATSGEYQTALELGKEFLSLAEQNGDPAIVVGHRLIGQPLFWKGDLPAARKHLEQVVSLYDPAQHRQLTWLYGQEPGMAGHAFLALTLWFLGYPDSALKQHEETLRLAREVSHAQSQAYALTFAAMHLQIRGDCQGTRELAEKMTSIASEHGLPVWLAWGKILLGWTRAKQGQAAEGIREMQSGLKIMQNSGVRIFHSYYRCLLGEGYREAKQFDEGLRTLAEAVAFRGDMEEHFWEAEEHRLKGELLSLQGAGIAEVEQSFQKAIELARKQSAKSLELRAVMSLSRLWQGQGKVAEGRELLAQTYGWFTEGFDTPDLQAAKELLEELS